MTGSPGSGILTIILPGLGGEEAYIRYPQLRVSGQGLPFIPRFLISCFSPRRLPNDSIHARNPGMSGTKYGDWHWHSPHCVGVGVTTCHMRARVGNQHRTLRSKLGRPNDLPSVPPRRPCVGHWMGASDRPSGPDPTYRPLRSPERAPLSAHGRSRNLGGILLSFFVGPGRNSLG
ncbi:hypothetical protein F4801DRAFT_227492 [Xylaria longipes]|nr:hypothetical protein F4801DRAFT_227492 [Xylaria longipes]